MPYLSDHSSGRVLLRVFVQPRASRTVFTGIHGDAIKLAITAPPVDGKANTAVIKFLASFLGIKKRVWILNAGCSPGTRAFLFQV